MSIALGLSDSSKSSGRWKGAKGMERRWNVTIGAWGHVGQRLQLVTFNVKHGYI